MQTLLWHEIIAHISSSTGRPFQLLTITSVSGGDINQAYVLKSLENNFFVKLNQPHCEDMFAAEVAGLTALRQNSTLKIPFPICYGQNERHSYLVLEWLDLTSANPKSSRLLGAGLAEMHLKVQPYFGWMRDNTIGMTFQSNNRTSLWLDFWRDQRLSFQLQLARTKGYQGKLQALGEQLVQSCQGFFIDYQPSPSLLHGDLWGGNVATSSDGEAVIFDPACYYGDREADLAMTELFGGFSADFYAAYQAHWPLDSGYSVRKDFYNLYHILNHLNMFGGTYLHQAEHMLTRLLAELK